MHAITNATLSPRDRR